MRIVLGLVLLVGCSSDPEVVPEDAAHTIHDGADDAAAPVGTAGCGMPTTIGAGDWVEQSVDVGSGARPYFVRLPDSYDPARRYPVVYQQHGCSGNANRDMNNVPLEAQAGAEAILVRGRAASTCWDTNVNGVDFPYWDAMRADVEERWCVDPSRRFATGYSSGAFMTHRLGCVRGDLLRGIATIAGGQAESGCAAPVAALLIHDSNDDVVDVSASIAARDSHLTRNGCGTTTTPAEPSPCVAYEGCAATTPVTWCQTSGQAHARQDAFAAPIFWGFLSGL